MIKNIITKERLEKEFNITGRALDCIEISITKDNELYEKAKKFLEFAQNYYDDALHFKNKGDFASAFGALNYAHAWLDAGMILEVFKGDTSQGLFVVE